MYFSMFFSFFLLFLHLFFSIHSASNAFVIQMHLLGSSLRPLRGKTVLFYISGMYLHHMFTSPKCISVIRLHPGDVFLSYIYIPEMYLFYIHDADPHQYKLVQYTFTTKGKFTPCGLSFPHTPIFLSTTYTAVNGCPDGVSLRLPIDCS